MNFDETDEFSKDFKRLSKKYKPLSDDLLEFKKVVSKFPLGTSKHFIVLIAKETIKIIKGCFFCRYLKGSSLRIIYAYCEKSIGLNLYNYISRVITKTKIVKELKIIYVILNSKNLCKYQPR